MLRSRLFWVTAAATLARNKRHFVPQNTVTDCGVACVMTLLRMQGQRADPEAISLRLDPDRTGTSLEAIRATVEDACGVPARALAVRPDKLGSVRCPAILHMERMHYVVLLRVGPDGMLCFDPAQGPVFFPRADIESLFSGYLVTLSDAPLQKKKDESHVGFPKFAAVKAALLFSGVASRMLEIGLILSFCLGLFFVANQASVGTLVAIAAMIAVIGLLLIAVRRLRSAGQETWVSHGQSWLWRGLTRTLGKGRDLIGFRNQREREVAARLRKGFIVEYPQRAQFPAALGSTLVLACVLALLSPIVAIFYLAAMAGLVGISLLDEVSLCRRSVKARRGRYSKLHQSRYLANPKSAQLLFGEAGKWTVIGVAGVGALMSGLPVPVLLFWVLLGMRVVVEDFKNAPALAQAFAADPVSPLVGAEVAMRRQHVVGDFDLNPRREKGLIVIDGIKPLTQWLQNPDLTVREQRLILAGIVEEATRALPKETRNQLGSVRLFGPGHDVTEADFETLVLTAKPNNPAALPAKRGEADVAAGRNDPIARAMKTCGPKDFPVFWDVRNQLDLADLRARAKQSGLPRAGHLSMTRLTVVEAA